MVNAQRTNVGCNDRGAHLHCNSILKHGTDASINPRFPVQYQTPWELRMPNGCPRLWQLQCKYVTQQQ